MKRIATILTLAITILASGTTVEAKTTKKARTHQSSQRQTASVVGDFKYADNTISLYADGKARSNDKRTKGSYKKVGEGTDYVVLMENQGGWYNFLIVDGQVYEIGVGSAGVITNFNYDPASKIVIITEVDGSKATSDDLDTLGFSSFKVPLSKFIKMGPVSWKNI